MKTDTSKTTELLDKIDELSDDDFANIIETAFWRRRRNHRDSNEIIGETIGKVLCDASNGCDENDVAKGMKKGIFDGQHRTLQQGAVRIFQRALRYWVKDVGNDVDRFTDMRNEQAFKFAQKSDEIPLPLI